MKWSTRLGEFCSGAIRYVKGIFGMLYVSLSTFTSQVQKMLYHHTPYLLTEKKITLAFRRSGHGAFLTFAGCLLAVATCGMLIPSMMQDIATREETQNSSVWLWRGSKDYVMTPVRKVIPMFHNEFLATQFNANKSYYILGPGEDNSRTIYKLMKPIGKNIKYKEIAFYDPLNQLKYLSNTNFSKCEYRKCRIAKTIEQADAVVFLASRLNMTKPPSFKRKSGQIWVFHTTDGPTKFSFYASFNKPGIRNLFNWTMTYRNRSDIRDLHGFLKLKPQVDPRDYSALYDKKSKTAAWFVTQCPTRSKRQLYVSRMRTRMDVDVYGECGTLQCGTAKKGPGGNMRKLQDNSTCFPLVSVKYKFYLAFENTMCREFITDQFFKLFGTMPVDAVPVVRGGANYKKFFPPDMYVDASDFSTPEDLADYLLDLGNDKERYIRMLKAKDRWQAVPGFPDWQCSLCKKLHTDTKKSSYKNVVEWFIKDQCFDDAQDGLKY